MHGLLMSAQRKSFAPLISCLQGQQTGCQLHAAFLDLNGRAKLEHIQTLPYALPRACTALRSSCTPVILHGREPRYPSSVIKCQEPPLASSAPSTGTKQSSRAEPGLVD